MLRLGEWRSVTRAPAILLPAEAARLVESGDTILIGGSGGGLGTPERFLEALAARFEESGQPRNLTAVHPVGCGDWGEKGMSRLARSGLLKRQITGSLGNSPATMALAAENRIEAYTLPQGVLSQLCRDIAAGRPGLVTHVGLGSFVDPRQGGGRQSALGEDELVRLIEIEGKEFLFFPAFPVHVAIIRATTADEAGNLTMEKEPFIGEVLAMAQAAHNSGGLVIAQVERLCKGVTPSSRDVRVPGILVDAIIVDPDQPQTYAVRYNPGYSGEIRVPVPPAPQANLDVRSIIARRACLELAAGFIVNLGYGISTGIPDILAQEGVLDAITLTVEQGVIGGRPASGNDFGAAVNFHAMIEQTAQFDFYDGGGLDMAFLSFAEVDRVGNVNVSRFSGRPNGSGGFIHIAQNAKSICFLGTLTTGGLEVAIEAGRLSVLRDGVHRRFVSTVEQKTYDRAGGRARNQRALFITERAVLEDDGEGLRILEIAPGVDLQRDVLANFAVAPRVAPDLREMPEIIFRSGLMGLKEIFAAKTGRPYHVRIAKLLAMEESA
jgi:propionate CoA-transferase